MPKRKAKRHTSLSRSRSRRAAAAGRQSPSHSHLFTIGDDEAVGVLLEKLLALPSEPVRAERLLGALSDAADHYKDSDQKVRQAFFHGLLTGYGVGLKLL